MERLKACEGCDAKLLSPRVLRYVKIEGIWKYLCKSCRNKLRATEEKE